MKKILVAILLATFALKNFAAAVEAGRVTKNFDANWRFLKADASGAEQNSFDDSAWRQLDVPHDWSIEGPFAATNKAGGAGAFLPGGIGWYRKYFLLPAEYSNRCVSIEFDGVMANSDVWINGFHLGKRPYGYVSFSYELTGHLNFGGKENVIAVRTDTSAQPASRWYEGAGIYRHVRLVETDPVHIVKDGAFISTPQISATQATVHVQTTVTNESDFQRPVFVMVRLQDLIGKDIGFVESNSSTLLAAGKSVQFNQDIIVTNPQLWSLEKPVLYRALVVTGVGEKTGSLTVAATGKKLPDKVYVSWNSTPDIETNYLFGIRDAKFIADTGFWLNGQNIKIKGACLHSDGGAFGAAVPLGIWEQRLTELKKLGVNAIRTAHNPPAPEFLDLCDRLGLLVMDEFFDCWTVAKNPYDYHLHFNEWSQIDERDTILRDRNHPSVILYSVGNEIHDTPQAEKAKKILAGLVEVAHVADPTRPVTQALFRPNVSHDYDDGLADMLDVVGQNYRESEILAAHAQNPARKIIGTENTHTRQVWLALRDNPPYAGQFLWSGIDYLGEAPRWPAISRNTGLLGRTGTPHVLAFERQSWWSDQPMVALTRRVAATALMPDDPGYGADPRDAQVLFSDWTPADSAPHPENVEVYSNCQEVELFLNGRSLGVKPLNHDAAARNWRVAYAPGTLKAVAKNDGKIVATDELRTARAPAKIVLTPDAGTVTNNWDGVVRLTATITDKNGVVVPTATNRVSFKLAGPGVIAAVDNDDINAALDNSGDTVSHESFQASECRAFQGAVFAFVKATASSGRITLTASAPGLTGNSATIKISEAP